VSKILVADDEPDVRELCRTILTGEGYEVLEAQNGPECVSVASGEKPDLILLDWMMPGVDGMDTLRALKSLARTSLIPVVMLTALDGVAQINLATYIGAEGYVTKPFEVEDLLSLVRRFTQR
jgi:CheY-like chemotaxis protein